MTARRKPEPLDPGAVRCRVEQLRELASVTFSLASLLGYAQRAGSAAEDWEDLANDVRELLHKLGSPFAQGALAEAITAISNDAVSRSESLLERLPDA